MSRVLANASAVDRPDTDFYATPEDVTEALILKMGWPTSMSVWEPAAGDERMANVFRNRGYDVSSTDINLGPKWDFTKLTTSYGDLIVTNPPVHCFGGIHLECISLTTTSVCLPLEVAILARIAALQVVPRVPSIAYPAAYMAT